MTFAQMVVRVVGSSRSAKRGGLHVFFSFAKAELYSWRDDRELDLTPWAPTVDDVTADDWEIVP